MFNVLKRLSTDVLTILKTNPVANMSLLEMYHSIYTNWLKISQFPKCDLQIEISQTIHHRNKTHVEQRLHQYHQL